MVPCCVPSLIFVMTLALWERVRAVGLISEASSDVRENRLQPCYGHANCSLYPWPACGLRESGAGVAAKQQHQAKQQPVIDDV